MFAPYRAVIVVTMGFVMLVAFQMRDALFPVSEYQLSPIFTA